jgi:predicted nucleic acid-binding protein
MILADTSAWVEYDRATGSVVDRRLTELIAAEVPIAVTEPVIMEVLAGARSDAREADLRRLLLRFHLYRFDAAADFEGAAHIYRRCRQAGTTPRGLVDCMIAAVALRHKATLLACDTDLDRIARIIGIDLDKPASSEPPYPAK